jgi:oligopeptidase B
VLKQQQEVLGYDGSQYLSRLVWATSAPLGHGSSNSSISGEVHSGSGSTGDSVQVPISLAYRADRVALDGSDPLLLEAYGAYGASSDPDFSGQ